MKKYIGTPLPKIVSETTNVVVAEFVVIKDKSLKTNLSLNINSSYANVAQR